MTMPHSRPQTLTADHVLLQTLRLSRLTSVLVLFTMGLNLGMGGGFAWDIWAMMLPACAAVTLAGWYFSAKGMTRLVKRLPEHDSETLEKTGIMVCLTAMGALTLTYIFGGGYLNLFLMATLPVVFSQLLGLSRVTRLGALWLLLLGVGGIIAGYPKLTPAPAWLMAGTVNSLGNGIASLGNESAPVMLANGLSTLISLVPWLFLIATVLHQLCINVRASLTRVEKLQSLAATDALTGLINRRQFNSRLFSEISRARRHHHHLTLALFDIDHFKKVNDFYGHQVGDRILKELGALIRENVRESDMPARYGGEEFALILPETRIGEGYELLERIRAMIERHVFCLPENPLPITISVGLAQLDAERHTAFELVELADTALYEAKHQGRNRVVSSTGFGVKQLKPVGQYRPTSLEPVSSPALP